MDYDIAKGKYDFFMSVGSHCRPALYLRRYGLRTTSSPLDWMMGYRLETVEYLFRTSFEDFFQECTEIKENNKLLKKEGHRWIEDTQNQIVSVHHFSTGLPLQEQRDKFYSKMKERYHRTSNLIREAKKVALIGTWSDGFEVLEEFLKKFGALYDKTAFTFINIRNNENIDNMIVRDRIISKNLKLIDYEFHDTTSESGIEAESSIQGWHTIMNSLWLIKQPFIEKIRSTPPPRTFVRIWRRDLRLSHYQVIVKI